MTPFHAGGTPSKVSFYTIRRDATVARPHPAYLHTLGRSSATPTDLHLNAA